MQLLDEPAATRMTQRLKQGDVAIDQPLPWDVYDDMGQLLLTRGFVIQTASQLSALMERGLYIEKKEELPVAHSHRMVHVFAMCDILEDRLDRTLAQRDPDTFTRNIERIAQEVSRLSRDHFDATFANRLLTSGDNYAISHQLHCAVFISRVLGQLPQIDPSRHQSIVCAALTMNIGMITLQTQLLHQRASLNATQMDGIKRHPMQGRHMLELMGVKDPLWLQMVEQHHEQPDGYGYPTGMRDPILEAYLLHLIDVFCAKICSRGYRQAMSAKQAAQQMFAREGGSAQSLASLLIKEAGVYPPGTFVTLFNGELGIVIKRGADAVSPVVAALLDTHGHAYAEPVIRQCGAKPLTIIATQDKARGWAKINPQQLWHQFCALLVG